MKKPKREKRRIYVNFLNGKGHVHLSAESATKGAGASQEIAIEFAEVLTKKK